MRFKLDENLPSQCATLLSLSEQSILAAQNSIMRLVSSFSKELPINKLWIVDESKIRIRE